MEVSQAIAARRSIRRFRSTPVPREVIEGLLDAAVKAPSGKNLQPWGFVVLEGRARNDVADLITEGVRRFREAGLPLGSEEATAEIMRRAPVTILVFDRVWNPGAGGEPGTQTPDGSRPWSIVDIQSIGAAIENLILAAEEAGLGTLWICDVFIAWREISQYVERADQCLIAAVAVGYADEKPAQRNRKSWRDLTTWKA